MDEERLKALEGWAGYPDRDPQAARLVRELVREVRRLKAAAVPDGMWIIPAPLPDVSVSVPCANVIHRLPEPATVPPFRGILAPHDGKRCVDVYGVEV